MGGRHWTRLLVSVSVVVLVGMSGVVSAHRQSKSDPNDTSGALDISSLLFAHDRKTLSVTVRTFSGWSSSILRGRRYIRVDVDPPGGNDYGYAIYARYRNGDLRGIVKRVSRDFSYRKVGNARVRRPSGRAVRLTVSRELIDAKSGVSWSAQAWDGSHYDRTASWFHNL